MAYQLAPLHSLVAAQAVPPCDEPPPSSPTPPLPGEEACEAPFHVLARRWAALASLLRHRTALPLCVLISQTVVVLSLPVGRHCLALRPPLALWRPAAAVASATARLQLALLPLPPRAPPVQLATVTVHQAMT